MNVWGYVYFALILMNVGLAIGKWGEVRNDRYGWITLVSLAISATIVWFAIH